MAFFGGKIFFILSDFCQQYVFSWNFFFNNLLSQKKLFTETKQKICQKFGCLEKNAKIMAQKMEKINQKKIIKKNKMNFLCSN